MLKEVLVYFDFNVKFLYVHALCFCRQEELTNATIKMAEQSKVLNTPRTEKQTKREFFDALRQELE